MRDDVTVEPGEWVIDAGLYDCAGCGATVRLEDLDARAPDCPSCPSDNPSFWFLQCRLVWVGNPPGWHEVDGALDYYCYQPFPDFERNDDGQPVEA